MLVVASDKEQYFVIFVLALFDDLILALALVPLVFVFRVMEPFDHFLYLELLL